MGAILAPRQLRTAKMTFLGRSRPPQKEPFWKPFRLMLPSRGSLRLKIEDLLVFFFRFDTSLLHTRSITTASPHMPCNEWASSRVSKGAHPLTYSIQTVCNSVECNTIRCGPKPNAHTGGACPKPVTINSSVSVHRTASNNVWPDVVRYRSTRTRPCHSCREPAVE